MMINKIIKYLSSQAIQSAIFKGLTGFFMFISISFLVRYLGETGYGIWVLVFSFFQWGLYFDFGISNENEGKNLNQVLSYWKESFSIEECRRPRELNSLIYRFKHTHPYLYW